VTTNPVTSTNSGGRRNGTSAGPEFLAAPGVFPGGGAMIV